MPNGLVQHKIGQSVQLVKLGKRRGSLVGRVGACVNSMAIFISESKLLMVDDLVILQGQGLGRLSQGSSEN